MYEKNNIEKTFMGRKIKSKCARESETYNYEALVDDVRILKSGYVVITATKANGSTIKEWLTQDDIKNLMEKGRFREELYFSPSMKSNWRVLAIVNEKA